MLAYFNEFFSVVKQYVVFIFSLEFLPGVSIGSVYLLATFLWIITTTLWHRGK